MGCRNVLLCMHTVFCAAFSAAQTGTPVEVMPLHVGNTWTYEYRFGSIDNFLATEDDSGIVKCIITGMIPAGDSTRWIISEQRNFREILKNQPPMGPRDGTYTVVDSAAYEIVERLEGLHHLYRTETENYISISAFPWGMDFTDTASVNRYAYVDSAGMAEFETHSSAPAYGFAYTFAFKRGLGEQQVQTRTVNVVGLAAASRHTLLRSVIVSVRDPYIPPLPAAPVLSQNYPNPFNPATTIRYGLSHRSQVRLVVYNALGQQVAILMQGVQEAGYHEARFDGSGLSSGVYVYRLTAGEYSAAKKLLLVR